MKQPRILAILLLVAFLPTLSTRALAQGSQSGKRAPAAAPTDQGGDKIDVTDLEHKYWAAKDTDFSVVQNRLFNKAGRFALTTQYGVFMNETWSKGGTLSANLGYFFTERYGIEVAYSKTDSKDNSATENLKLYQGGAPNHNKMKNFEGVAFNYVPFYAKMSVLNSSIIYFDMSISPGVGFVSYEQQLVEGNVAKQAPAFTLDITQHFFLSNWFALRFDYKNRWFQEDVTQWQVSAPAVRSTTTQINNTSLFMMGATFYY